MYDPLPSYLLNIKYIKDGERHTHFPAMILLDCIMTMENAPMYYGDDSKIYKWRKANKFVSFGKEEENNYTWMEEHEYKSAFDFLTKRGYITTQKCMYTEETLVKINYEKLKSDAVLWLRENDKYITDVCEVS